MEPVIPMYYNDLKKMGAIHFHTLHPVIHHHHLVYRRTQSTVICSTRNSSNCRFLGPFPINSHEIRNTTVNILRFLYSSPSICRSHRSSFYSTADCWDAATKTKHQKVPACLPTYSWPELSSSSSTGKENRRRLVPEAPSF